MFNNYLLFCGPFSSCKKKTDELLKSQGSGLSPTKYIKKIKSAFQTKCTLDFSASSPRTPAFLPHYNVTLEIQNATKSNSTVI